MHDTLLNPLWIIEAPNGKAANSILSIPKWSKPPEHHAMEKWHDRAKTALKRQNRTIDDLAEKRGMTPGGMQKWLAGTRQPALDDILAIADELGVSRAWLLLGDEAAGELDALPDYAAKPLQLMAEGARTGQLDERWFACLKLAGQLADQARGLAGDAAPFGAFTATTRIGHSEEAAYLATEFDKVTDEGQRKMAFAQTQHLLRLLQQPGPAQSASVDTTSVPSVRQK